MEIVCKKTWLHWCFLHVSVCVCLKHDILLDGVIVTYFYTVYHLGHFNGRAANVLLRYSIIHFWLPYEYILGRIYWIYESLAREQTCGSLKKDQKISQNFSKGISGATNTRVVTA